MGYFSQGCWPGSLQRGGGCQLLRGAGGSSCSEAGTASDELCPQEGNATRKPGVSFPHPLEQGSLLLPGMETTPSSWWPLEEVLSLLLAVFLALGPLNYFLEEKCSVSAQTDH